MLMTKEEYEAVMNKTCHLILKHKWYDEIDKGEKTIEYRDNTEYWRRRIISAKYVTFYRGYTKTMMTFKIRYVKDNNDKLEIYLGERKASPDKLSKTEIEDVELSYKQIQEGKVFKTNNVEEMIVELKKEGSSVVAEKGVKE